MAEYIERELAIQAVVDTPCRMAIDKGKVIRAVEGVPLADVVEVVRCCECQYWESRNSINSQGICKCGNMEMNYGGEFYPMRNDFCSYGAKMDGKGE